MAIEPKKVVPKKVTPKKVAPKKVAPKKVAPKKVSEPIEEEVENVVVEETEVEETVVTEVVEEINVERAQEDLDLLLQEIVEDEGDFVKADTLHTLVRDSLLANGVNINKKQAREFWQGIDGILFDLITEHGKIFSVGDKRLRKSTINPRVYEAREGFSTEDTLTPGYEQVSLRLPVNKQESIRGTYDEEASTFTAEDGTVYNLGFSAEKGILVDVEEA